MKSIVSVFSLMVSVCLVLLTFSSVVSADKGAKDGRWLMAKYDSNGDAKISVDEIQFKRNKQFGLMDADNDGDVSLQEYIARDEARRQIIVRARFEKLDLDADGVLSDAEYSSFIGGFQRFDSDGDGNVSADEMGLSSPDNISDKKTKNVKTVCVSFVCFRNKLF